MTDESCVRFFPLFSFCDVTDGKTTYAIKVNQGIGDAASCVADIGYELGEGCHVTPLCSSLLSPSPRHSYCSSSFGIVL